jgi:hypothetical protein
MCRLTYDYSLIEHLLKFSGNVAYVRNFTAESFAFLLRKIRGDAYKQVVKTILERLCAQPDEELIHGVAVLFFECVKVSVF